MATNMTFVDFITPVPADWLNNVNTVVNTPNPVLTSNLVVNSIALLRAVLKTDFWGSVFVLGYYAPHDGGGGQYVYDSTDTSSTDNGGTIIVASDGGRWKLQWFGQVTVQQFGAKADSGVTDNSTVLANAAAWVFSGATTNQLCFSSGIYGYSVSPNWGISHARIVAEGEVRLRYSGTGSAVIIDAGAGAQNISDVTFGTPGNPFIVEPNYLTATADTVFVRAIHHSTICVKPRAAGANKAGIGIYFAVCTKFYITCSVNEDSGWFGGPSAKPFYGIFGTQRNASETLSYCSFYSPVIEGTNFGIWFDFAAGNLVLGGTAEGCTSTGLLETSNCLSNVFMKMDLEVNTIADIDTSSINSRYINCDTSNQIAVRGNGNEITGGVHQTINVAAGANLSYIHDLRFNRQTGGSFADSGTNTRQYGIVNWGGGSLLVAPAAAFTIPVPGTTVVYTNTLPYTVGVTIQGGTVTQVTLTRGVTTSTVFSGTSLNGGIFEVSPSDILTVTSSIAPTSMKGFPRYM